MLPSTGPGTPAEEVVQTVRFQIVPVSNGVQVRRLRTDPTEWDLVLADVIGWKLVLEPRREPAPTVFPLSLALAVDTASRQVAGGAVGFLRYSQ